MSPCGTGGRTASGRGHGRGHGLRRRDHHYDRRRRRRLDHHSRCAADGGPGRDRRHRLGDRPECGVGRTGAQRAADDGSPDQRGRRRSWSAGEDRCRGRQDRRQRSGHSGEQTHRPGQGRGPYRCDRVRLHPGGQRDHRPERPTADGHGGRQRHHRQGAHGLDLADAAEGRFRGQQGAELYRQDVEAQEDRRSARRERVRFVRQRGDRQTGSPRWDSKWWPPSHTRPTTPT